MKIAYILDTFPKISESYILNEIIELKKSEVDILIYAINRSNEEVMHDEAQALVHTVQFLEQNTRPSNFLTNLLLLFKHPFQFLKSRKLLPYLDYPIFQSAFKRAVSLAELFKTQKIDHIHSHFAGSATETSMCLSIMTGIPFSFTLHSSDIYQESHFLEDKIKYAKYVVTEDDSIIEHITRHNKAIDSKKFFHVNEGVNIQEFKSFQHDIVPNGHLNIILHGALLEKKGLHVLLQSLKNIDIPVRCKIIGDGQLREAIEKYIYENYMSGTIKISGIKTKHEIQKELSRADLFVLPSVIARDGDRDNFPLTLKEAMAMKLPFITTKLINRNISNLDDAGFIIDPYDPIQLRKAIRVFADLSQDQRKQMGKIGREIITEYFDIKQSTKRLKGLFISSTI